MIHGILQFTLLIAFRCVLHRCESLEIRCQKLFKIKILKIFADKRISRKFKTSWVYVNKRSADSTEQVPQEKYNKQCTKCLNGGETPRLLQGSETQLFVNDPTAGSPTVTLLRLLVPLNDQV